MIGLAIGSLGLVSLVFVALFWQMKQNANVVKQVLSLQEQNNDLKTRLIHAEIEAGDAQMASKKLKSERDRLTFTVDILEDQRDALLEESLGSDDPGHVAISVRNALERLRKYPPKEEKLPDLPTE